MYLIVFEVYCRINYFGLWVNCSLWCFGVFYIAQNVKPWPLNFAPFLTSINGLMCLVGQRVLGYSPSLMHFCWSMSSWPWIQGLNDMGHTLYWNGQKTTRLKMFSPNRWMQFQRLLSFQCDTGSYTTWPSGNALPSLQSEHDDFPNKPAGSSDSQL